MRRPSRRSASASDAPRTTPGRERAGGGSVRRSNAPSWRASSTRCATAGLGGVEVAVVYPLSAATDRFCSPTFLADLRWAAEQARDRGLTFDVTLGSGWSFGGPHVSAETAARRLSWERQEIAPGGVSRPYPGRGRGTSWSRHGSGTARSRSRRRRSNSWRSATTRSGCPRAGGPAWSSPRWPRLTGQNVKRAAARRRGPGVRPLLRPGPPGSTSRPSAIRSCRPSASSVSTPSSATASRCTGPTGHRGCSRSSAAGAATTPGLCSGCWPSTGPGRRGCGPITTGPSPSSTSRTSSSRCQRWASSRGVPFRIQGYGQPPADVSAATGSPTASRARAGAGRTSRRPVGVVRRPALRPPRRLVGDLDLGALAVLPGHPARPEGRAARAPAVRGQPGGRPWLAVLAAGRRRHRLDVLRGRCAGRAQPVVAGGAGAERYVHRLSELLRQGERVATSACTRRPGTSPQRWRSGREGALDLWRGVRDHIGPDILRACASRGTTRPVRRRRGRGARARPASRSSCCRSPPTSRRRRSHGCAPRRTRNPGDLRRRRGGHGDPSRVRPSSRTRCSPACRPMST